MYISSMHAGNHGCKDWEDWEEGQGTEVVVRQIVGKKSRKELKHWMAATLPSFLPGIHTPVKSPPSPRLNGSTSPGGLEERTPQTKMRCQKDVESIGRH